MTVHEEYTALIIERYERLKDESYEASGDYSCVLLAPEQYRVEASMLAYVKGHPNVSLKDVCNYFSEITPPGLPPGIIEADLWDND
ncbi:MAG: hypothetical protein LUD83_09785 [Clostridiales bacterium]|nr:hypothetical protein [Clostridiales bacterium]